MVKNARDGIIVLLHDTYSSSVDATLKAIDALREEDYEFVSLEELEQMKIIDIEKDKYFYSFGRK